MKNPVAFGARWSIFLALGLLAAACHEPDHVELCRLTFSGNVQELTAERIRLSRGAVVAVKVVPVRDDDKYMDKDTVVGVRVRDASILGVDPLDPAVNPTQCNGPEEVSWFYVLYGMSVGETELEISVDGEPMCPIAVDVF